MGFHNGNGVLTMRPLDTNHILIYTLPITDRIVRGGYPERPGTTIAVPEYTSSGCAR